MCLVEAKRTLRQHETSEIERLAMGQALYFVVVY